MKWFPITFFLLLALPAGAVLYVKQTPIFTAEVPAEESPTNGQQNVERTTPSDVVSQPQIERVPDFSACLDIRQKKRVFFECYR